MAQLRVLISGGGVAGTSLAFWLSKLGHDITVVERYPTLRATGLQIDLRGRGIEVLQRMGLEKAFREKAVPEEGLQFVDRNGRKRAYFGANDSGKGAQTFTSEYEIMRGDLCRIIFDATGSTAKYVFGTRIARFQEQTDGVAVSFEDGTSGVFDLVVGADGVHSSMRKMLVGPEASANAFHSVHENTAYMTFTRPAEKGERHVGTMYLATEKRSILTRRHSPDTMQLYLLLNRDDERLQQVRRGDVEAEKEAFIDIYRDAGWEAPQLLDEMRASDDFYCERLGVVKLPVWHRGRVALLGDAAYGPGGSGVGTTCAIVGAYVLAGEIGRHCGRAGGKQGIDTSADRAADGVEAALRAYDENFRPYMDTVQAGMGGPPEWMVPSTPFAITVFHFITQVIAFLWYDPLVAWFTKDVDEKWKLPSYAELEEA